MASDLVGWGAHGDILPADARKRLGRRRAAGNVVKVGASEPPMFPYGRFLPTGPEREGLVEIPRWRFGLV
jgi:hypothetical protein